MGSARSAGSRVNTSSILRCPRCGAGLAFLSDRMSCLNETCVYSAEGFPFVGGQPVLIDFTDSVFPRANYRRGNGSAFPRNLSAASFRSRLHLWTDGNNPVAAKNCDSFVALLKAQTKNPRVLVIGGGKIGLGADRLYRDPDVELIGTDVFASDHTSLLCDAHKLPFEDGSFDGVWTQAVLEHVLDPHAVVAEIRRVLKPGGLVYAETPFMQQVHERAYDFTRFTKSGHRWLFRKFEEISSGSVAGPAVVFLWSMRYLLRALGVGDKLSQVIVLAFFWIRILDRFCDSKKAEDAASGVYFLGRRSDKELPAVAMVKYYQA